MTLRRPGGDHQLILYLGIGQPARQEDRHLALAGRQSRVEVRRQRELWLNGCGNRLVPRVGEGDRLFKTKLGVG